MFIQKDNMVTQEGHRIFITTRDNKNCLMGVEHRKPCCERSRDLRDARLPAFSEDVKPILAEGFDGFSLVTKRVKLKDAG
jgi:hypothetical protein